MRTQLHGVVVPRGRQAVGVARGAAVLRLDGVALAAALLDLVEHPGDAERVRRQRHPPAAHGVPLGAGLALEAGVVDAAVVEQPALDVLIGRHHAIDVLQVVQPRAVRHLVERADGDGVGRNHGGVLLGCREPFRRGVRSSTGDLENSARRSGRIVVNQSVVTVGPTP